MMRASMSGFVLALGLLAGSGVRADAGLETCLSGFEIFPGRSVGDTTTGVTFAGTDSAGELCPWSTNSLGGVWFASINREGQAGIGGAVTVTGGKWLWERAHGGLHRGRVTRGTVTWPDSLEDDLKNGEHLGCGPGVARFSVTLSVVGHPQGGTFEGCLDDTHLDPRVQPFVFPPHISGKLTILP